SAIDVVPQIDDEFGPHERIGVRRDPGVHLVEQGGAAVDVAHRIDTHAIGNTGLPLRPETERRKPLRAAGRRIKFSLNCHARGRYDLFAPKYTKPGPGEISAERGKGIAPIVGPNGNERQPCVSGGSGARNPSKPSSFRAGAMRLYRRISLAGVDLAIPRPRRRTQRVRRP